MDLTRLYNLTTPELREEAERLGVGDTYAMSRGQLIHAIRSAASGGPQSEGLLGKVLGFAKWALQAAQEEPRKGAASRPPRGEALDSGSEASEQGEARRFERPAEPPMRSVGAGSESGSGSVAGPVAGAVAAPVAAPAGENAIGSESVTGSEPAAELDSGPPSRPPAGVFSKTASMFEEPFPTLTMARILAEQGHFKRALAIYATLQRDEPEDRELSAEADAVRAQSRARRSQIH